MAANTKISWAHRTLNFWIGCTRVGPGCDNCYAADLDRRFGYTAEGWGPGKPRHRTAEATRRQLSKWNRDAAARGVRHRVFVNSLSDVFDNEIDPSWRKELFETIRACPNLDCLLLTKRIGNVPAMLPDDWGDGWPNVWIGVTVCDQAEADRDIGKLLAVPARIRFLSIEPMLEGIDLRFNGGRCVDWIIVGAESGSRRRPFDPAWVRFLRDQVLAPGEGLRPAFHFKQAIENGKTVHTPALDGRVWDEVPAARTVAEKRTWEKAGG